MAYMDTTDPRTGKPYTSGDYRAAAEGNLFFAQRLRLQGDDAGSVAHRDLAGLYIKQELRRPAQ